MRLTIWSVFLLGCIAWACFGLCLPGPGMPALTAMQVEGKQAKAKVSDGEPSETAATSYRAVVKKFCVDCHSGATPKGDLDLDSLVGQEIKEHAATWEQVLRKLRSRQMPPAGQPRPAGEIVDQAMNQLVKVLDRGAEKNPQPGRTNTFRRLNRFEYQNAIRDLLDLEIDAKTLLPADESSHGFDNVTLGDLPPTLLTRYISAAQKISRLAIGAPRPNPTGYTFRVAPDVTQEKHVPGLPLGTRGGVLLHHTFPQAGEYEVHVHLARDRNEHIEGLNRTHEMEFLLDRVRVANFKVVPPKNRNRYIFDDDQLKSRISVTAGPHDLGITFIKNKSSLLETKRQPLNVHFNYHRHPRLTPAVYQVSITGPYKRSVAKSQSASKSLNTPSRQRIFSCYPTRAEEEEACAERIISQFARRAYRRPVDKGDLARPLAFYREAHAEDGFEAGIEMAISSILVSPRFLLRVERDPAGIAKATAYPVSDLELASRLSFFLWSSIPDDELLALASRGELRKAGVLKKQMERMLADPRSRSLVTNFASQWLYLRNLDSKTPNARIFPDFDDNLRQAFRQETELFVESVMREDRSVLDLLKADYTYLNERLARHYGIPHVYGSRFRRVEVSPESHRGGLLRHGSILTVTSYATRTSPVIRGNWILENILAMPTPPPPPNVPVLEEKVVGAEFSIRKRLAQHRTNPACASCHNIMDPIGFALENYDAVGRWRDYDAGQPVDAAGGLIDGTKVEGISGLEAGILKQPELFVAAMTEKLLTYALGRGIELDDGPAIRQVVRQAARDEYRFSVVIRGIIESPAFQQRMSK